MYCSFQIALLQIRAKITNFPGKPESVLLYHTMPEMSILFRRQCREILFQPPTPNPLPEGRGAIQEGASPPPPLRGAAAPAPCLCSCFGGVRALCGARAPQRGRSEAPQWTGANPRTGAQVRFSVNRGCGDSASTKQGCGGAAPAKSPLPSGDKQTASELASAAGRLCLGWGLGVGHSAGRSPKTNRLRIHAACL